MAGLVARILSVTRLDGAKQRALLHLRLRLLLRQFQREPGRMAGFVVFLLIFGPIILLLAAGSGFAYIAAPDPWPVQLLGIVLTALWLAWIALPLFAFRTNEGLDLARLLVYPLTTRDLVASALAGTLFDGPSYVTIPFFLAILVGWSGAPWLYVIIAPALVIAYSLMMISGQLVLTVSTGLLRSRRFRDLSIVVFSLIGSSCYFINRAVANWAEAAQLAELRTLEPLLLLRWLPPGACAQAVAATLQGDWRGGALWLAYALLWLALLTWAWWRLLLRMTTGAAAWSLPARASQPHRRAVRAPAGASGLTLPAPAARAVLVKEVKLAWRVPQRRIGLLQSVLAPFVLIGAFFLGDVDALRRLPEWTALGLPAVMLFAAWGLSANMIGMESRGLATLLLTPAPRWQILAGKGFAYALMALIPTSVYALVLGFVVGSPLVLLGLLAGIATALTTVGVNMITGVYYAYPFDENATTRQRSGGGCSTGIAQTIVTPLAMAVAAAPATLPLTIGVWLNRPEIAVLGAGAGLIYAAGLFSWTTRYAGAALAAREAEVLAAATLIQ